VELGHGHERAGIAGRHRDVRVALFHGVDPYPRKPGAVLEVSSAGDDSVKPFAALAALKKGQGGSAG